MKAREKRPPVKQPTEDEREAAFLKASGWPAMHLGRRERETRRSVFHLLRRQLTGTQPATPERARITLILALAGRLNRYHWAEMSGYSRIAVGLYAADSWLTWALHALHPWADIKAPPELWHSLPVLSDWLTTHGHTVEGERLSLALAAGVDLSGLRL